MDINTLVAELMRLVSDKIKSRKGLHSFVEEVVKPYVETTCDRFVEKKERELRTMLENVLTSLPNGKQGVPYEVYIPLSADLLEMLQEYVADPQACTCEVVEGIGLSCEWAADLSSIRLFGEPTVYGESVGLTLRFSFIDSQNVFQTVDSHSTFVVAADPKKLWNNIETPLDIPFYKADEFSSAEFVPGEKRIVAASKRGRSHAHTGKPRDDHFEFKHLDNGWYVLAVADGAGSAIYSREGSKVACRTVVEHCVAKLQDSTKLDANIWAYYDCDDSVGTDNQPVSEDDSSTEATATEATATDATTTDAATTDATATDATTTDATTTDAATTDATATDATTTDATATDATATDATATDATTTDATATDATATDATATDATTTDATATDATATDATATETSRPDASSASYTEESESGATMRVADEQPSVDSLDKQTLKDRIGLAMFETLGHAAYRAHRAIKTTAEKAQSRTRDFATTMLLTICKKFGENGWFVASYWVGDGAVGIYTEGEAGSELQLMGEPDGGEFAGQTRFLIMPEVVTSEELGRRIRVSFVKDFTSLMLMTDGVSDPMFDTDANLLRPDKWKDLWENLNAKVPFADPAVEPEELSKKLLDWLDFWAVGNHDDRTILVVY